MARLVAAVPADAFGQAANLAADWQDRIPADVLAMAEAWVPPEAWTGMTAASGVDSRVRWPAWWPWTNWCCTAGTWPRPTGQPAGYDGPGLEAVLGMVQHFRDAGVEGLFGPAVDVPEDAPLLDRLLGLAGRDPDWQMPAP